MNSFLNLSIFYDIITFFNVNRLLWKEWILKILGIDPGTKNCGYAVIEKTGRDLKLIEAGLIKIKTTVLQEKDLKMFLI